MPLYDFHCEYYGAEFEIRASIKEKQAGLNPECPTCHNYNARQIITAGLVVRGSDRETHSVPLSACGPNAGPGCCGG